MPPGRGTSKKSEGKPDPNSGKDKSFFILYHVVRQDHVSNQTALQELDKAYQEADTEENLLNSLVGCDWFDLTKLEEYTTVAEEKKKIHENNLRMQREEEKRREKERERDKERERQQREQEQRERDLQRERDRLIEEQRTAQAKAAAQKQQQMNNMQGHMNMEMDPSQPPKLGQKQVIMSAYPQPNQMQQMAGQKGFPVNPHLGAYPHNAHMQQSLQNMNMTVQQQQFLAMNAAGAHQRGGGPQQAQMPGMVRQPPQQNMQPQPIPTQQQPTVDTGMPPPPKQETKGRQGGKDQILGIDLSEQEKMGEANLRRIEPVADSNMAIAQKIYQTIELNRGKVAARLDRNKVGCTHAFLELLHYGMLHYIRNVIDELIKVSFLDQDANEYKLFSSNKFNLIEDKQIAMLFENDRDKIVLTNFGEHVEKKSQTQFFLVRTSTLSDDQKMVVEEDTQEQTGLEQKYLNASNEEEEKITKKLKKDKTEYADIIKHLYDSKNQRFKENEDQSQAVKNANLAMEIATARTSSQLQSSMSGMGANSQKDLGAKNRKALSQRMIRMKHIIYYMENHPNYKKSCLLHRAYLK